MKAGLSASFTWMPEAFILPTSSASSLAAAACLAARVDAFGKRDIAESISAGLQKKVERIQKELVSEKELEGAKKYLVGSFPMRLDTQRKLANFLMQVEYYGLGMDYAARYPGLIQAITREDILRVAQKYLYPDNNILIVVADIKAAGLD